MLRYPLSMAIAGMLAAVASAQEFKVEKLDAAAPTDGVAAEVTAIVAPTGFKLVKGESRTICEIWPCQEWPIAADAKTTGEVLYPLTPGQLIGLVRYPRKATDFRDQEIAAGLYTLRYGQQPVDGAHVGTSPTRDFFVVTPVEKDQTAAVLDYKTLVAGGKETSGTSHPAILSLQRPGESTEALAVREDSEHEWTIVRFTGKTKAGDNVKDLAIEAVLVGVAAE
jgi:hypothetical protein